MTTHEETKTKYEKFTLKLIWLEIAPHTWPAAIMPTLLATALAATHASPAWGGAGSAMPTFSVVTVLALLAISILMQSSVNVFNDYYDYIKGLDTVENTSSDKLDAILVHFDINPKSALRLAVGLLVAAFAVGVYIISVAGFIPLAIGVVGAVFVALYSAGKTPISYYPIGELVSGFVMGGLITLACYYVLTGMLDLLVLVFALPLIIGIGLIMFTNNTCDVEKDAEAGRKTLTVLLGRAKALKLYHVCMFTMIACVWVMPFLWNVYCEASSAAGVSTEALINYALFIVLVGPFMQLSIHGNGNALLNNPLIPETRIAAMPQILNLNIMLSLFYVIALLLPHVFTLSVL